MFELLVSFIAGFLVKTVDLSSDHRLRLNLISKTLIAVLYGFFIAYLISVVNIFPELWLGILIGVVFAGKVDSIGHYIGLGSCLFFLSILGLPRVNPLLLIIFITICIIEEYINDNISVKKSKKVLSKFLEVRPFLEVSALVSSVILNNYLIVLLLLSFDVGYLFSRRVF